MNGTATLVFTGTYFTRTLYYGAEISGGRFDSFSNYEDVFDERQY